MDVIIKTIDHSEQRYPTTGDWWFEPEAHKPVVLHIRVSRMGDWRKEMLVAHHELTEALLCHAAGIKGDDVDAFDIQFEKGRGTECADDDEPGDDIRAPYYKQHQFATGFERVMAAEMSVSWNDYEQSNLDLYK